MMTFETKKEGRSRSLLLDTKNMSMASHSDAGSPLSLHFGSVHVHEEKRDSNIGAALSSNALFLKLMNKLGRSD